MSPLTIAAFLATAGGLCALLTLYRVAWAVTAASVIAALAAVALIAVAAAMPISGPPPVPFVLWGATGSYAWASPDRDASPRTYAWRVPPDMLRELRGGSPLQVEGEETTDPEQRATEHDEAETMYRWSRLEPEGAEK